MKNVGELVDALSAEPDLVRVRHLHSRADNIYTPLYYATELLRALRTEKAAFRVAQRNNPGRNWLDPMVSEARPLVRELFGSDEGPRVVRGHSDRVDPLARWLRGVAGDVYPPLILTRAVARAIEEEYASSFWEQLRLYYDVTDFSGVSVTQPLREGDPVPVCNTVFAGKDPKRGTFGTNPRNLPRWRDPDRLSRILLAPEAVEDFSVRLNFQLEADLELIRQSSVVATVHPTESLDEYIWDSDDSRFRNVRPRDETHGEFPTSAEYVDTLKNGIDSAVAGGAPLVVLPELAVNKAQSDEVVAHWQSLQRDISSEADESATLPVVLVAGSYHSQHGDSSWRNTATVVGNERVCEIDKAVPFAYNAPGQHSDLIEDIPQLTYPSVTLFCSERMTMVVFVCVDFLLDSLRDLARDLDITLVVLPSMSGKSRVFGGLVAGHVAATQSAVVLANAILSNDDRSRGIIGHPRFDQQVCHLNESWREGCTAGPGVAIIDTNDPDASNWMPITKSS